MGTSGRRPSGGRSELRQQATQSKETINSSKDNKLDNFRKMSVEEAGNFIYNLPIPERNAEEQNNNSSLQALTNALDLHDKPLVLSDNDFDRLQSTEALDGMVLFRGLGYQSDDSVKNSIMYGDHTFQGKGAYGDGTYFSTRFSFARDMFSSGRNLNNSRLTAFIDKNKASVIEVRTRRNMFAREPSNVKRAFRGSGGGWNPDISNYALYKGYNVIKVPNIKALNGNGNYSDDTFYVPLHRGVIVFRENYKTTY